MNIDILFEVDKSLRRIVELSYPQIKVIDKGDPIPEHDFHCPLMSLPLVFKTITTTIPQKIPYLTSEKEKNEKWKNIIKTRKNIGIFWRGNTLQANYDNRCIPLKYFEKILNKDINLYALQKEISKEEKKLLRKYNITEFTEKLTNFAETAAYCSQMDLIITVDTSVAHLASAIGLKVWILIPYIPDFRWFWDTEKSPWYPNIKIFRQKKPEDWNSVVKEVVSEMELFFNT
jgi:ADP-heptose:LPS heptosyltransferase